VGVSKKLAVGWATWKLMLNPPTYHSELCDTKGTTMGHGVMMPTTTPSGCKWLTHGDYIG